jgi:putative endonuclease
MTKQGQNNSSIWYVYMVRCSDNTLYTGITTDLERRIAAHNSTKSGARYTNGRRPVHLVYHEILASRSEAARREWQIKKMTAEAKKKLL